MTDGNKKEINPADKSKYWFRWLCKEFNNAGNLRKLFKENIIS